MSTSLRRSLNKLPLCVAVVEVGQSRPHPAGPQHVARHVASHGTQAARDGPRLTEGVIYRSYGLTGISYEIFSNQILYIEFDKIFLTAIAEGGP